MGRDFMYKFFSDISREELQKKVDTYEYLGELEEKPEFRNYVPAMTKIFTYEELYEYVEQCLENEELTEVHALTYLLIEWDGDYLVLYVG